MKHALLLSMLIAISLSYSFSQQNEAAAWAAEASDAYIVHVGRVYGTANNQSLKLDIWQQREVKEPVPTVIYFHGGGWVVADYHAFVPYLFPYLQKGWNAVNVEYRLAGSSLAPGAVEDCRCALRWVIQNAKQYGIDPNRLILTGGSAGGHLALITAMLPESAGLDSNCPGNEPLRVSAVVNWFGITDVADLLDGQNYQNYADRWLGSQANRKEIAKRVSPLTYVRSGLPPIITIHGDADRTVPYAHATRLHAALQNAGVPSKLITVPGGKHGWFGRRDYVKIYEQIFEFINTNTNIGQVR